MGYVQELRKQIGHYPVMLVGAVALIVDKQGAVLLQKRKYPEQYWGLPGGLMELGETAEETAKREVFEETGLTIHNLQLFQVYSGVKTPSRAANGDQYFPVTIAYLAEMVAGEWKIDSKESETFEFRSIENLPDLILKNHRIIINEYFLKRGKENK
ncbi:NUDIX hydrolase [Sporolactobacillus kofuensis]|uniref:NUDIX hydrolase n=1 Tax=Sporolactobacillus kofuensis TaxID=269672 RepID=A0ABW1WG85_9BACL|nr:NUDIX domain-containing protein [Sporolactobacillus kofuensis]MCO7176658.1 NUDIX domain-containing protein [Sporolactobacillus kofuensis]